MLVSAITIPDMIRIIEHHGLVPVPVDLDSNQMTPTLGNWHKAVTPATRAILVAHLFGTHVPMKSLLEFARQYGLLVFEDCAQAFAGLDYLGEPEADASMFSFGPIKSNTALGAAILRIKDPELLKCMQKTHAAYPVQCRWKYGKRLLKYAGLKTLTCRPICAFFVKLCKVFGFNYDHWANHSARSFPGDKLIIQLRHQPSLPLLAVLNRRLMRFDIQHLEKQIQKGRNVLNRLNHGIVCPGGFNPSNTFWVLPVLTNRPEELINHLTKKGYDATQGHSLCVAKSSVNDFTPDTKIAEELLSKIVFLPFYSEMPDHEALRMAEEVLEITA